MKKHLLKIVLLAVGLLLSTTSTWAATIETMGDKDKGWDNTGSKTSYTLQANQTLKVNFTVAEVKGAATTNGYFVNLNQGGTTIMSFQPNGGFYYVGEGKGWWYWNGNAHFSCSWWNDTAGYTDFMTSEVIKDADVELTIRRSGTQVYYGAYLTKNNVTQYVCYLSKTSTFDASQDVEVVLGADFAVLTNITDNITNQGTLLGVEDNTGGFGVGVRKDFTIAKNSTQSFHFTNHSKKAEKWHNWIFEMQYGDAYADIASGGGSWGALINENAANVDFTGSSWPAGTDDDFKDAYNGADVKLTITREGAKVSVEAVHTAVDKETWTVKYSFTPDEEGFADSDANFRLLTEGGHIDLLPYELNVSANNAAYGTVEAGTAYAGEEVTVTATPNAGFKFVNWTEGENEVSTDATYTFTAQADRTLVANFAPVGIVVGATDFTTGYLGANSTPVTLSPNQKVTYTFYNYSDKTASAHNWLACVGGETFATNALKVALRADNWENVQWANTGLSSNYNWDTFLSEMDGSKVVLSFTYQNNAVIVRADITSKSNNSYFEEFTKKGITGDITVALGVENSFLVITDQATENLPVVTESKTMTDAGWATYCSANALDLTGEIANLTDAYIITGGNNTTKYVYKESVKGQIVPANVGLLLEGTAGEIVFPVADANDATTDAAGNALVGVTAEETLAAEAGYVLLKENEVVAFYKNLNAFTLGDNTAYLPASFAEGAFEGAPRFYALDGETTGIDNLNVDAEASKAEGTIYNLAGQRVSKDYKGLVILNGKKVIIK